MINLDPLLNSDAYIIVHTVAAIVAFFLGALVLWRRKGGRIHKLSGYIWVIAMVVVAGTSFFIHELKVWGNYSPIHILSFVTFISLALAIIYVRRRNIRAHRQTMQSLYIGAMLVAGGLAFMPGRIMYRVAIEPFVSGEWMTDGILVSRDLAWQAPIALAIVAAVLYYFVDWYKSRAQ